MVAGILRRVDKNLFLFRRHIKSWCMNSHPTLLHRWTRIRENPPDMFQIPSNTMQPVFLLCYWSDLSQNSSRSVFYWEPSILGCFFALQMVNSLALLRTLCCPSELMWSIHPYLKPHFSRSVERGFWRCCRFWHCWVACSCKNHLNPLLGGCYMGNKREQGPNIILHSPYLTFFCGQAII